MISETSSSATVHGTARKCRTTSEDGAVGWERRTRGPGTGYYYQSVRTPQGTKKIDLGRGAAGLEAADKLANHLLARKQAKALLRADQDNANAVNQSTAELRTWSECLLSAWMSLSGHHNHHGEWRAIAMPKPKPRVGSRAWEESLVNDPTYARNTIIDLAKRAETGDARAIENLWGWLERFPGMRTLVRGLDDLSTQVLRAWVDRLVGADALRRKAVEDEVATMRAELLGPASSVAERTLATTVVVVAHLAYQRAAIRATQEGDVALQAAYGKQLTAAQSRLQDALRGWTILTRAKERGRRPPATLKVFEEVSKLPISAHKTRSGQRSPGSRRSPTASGRSGLLNRVTPRTERGRLGTAPSPPR